MDVMCDEELIERFRSTGELRHFDELVSRYVGKVHGMIYPMVLNHADADDLTQETLLRATRHIAGFRQRSKFSTWLYRIAMNTTKTFLSRRSGGPVEYFADPAEPSQSQTPRCGSVEFAEIDGQVQTALAGLSPTLRAAINLTVFQGMSMKDAAVVDGCLAATMCWRVYEARRQLRKRLAKYLES